MFREGVYLWILGQADVMLADAGPSAKTAFDYEIYMKECHELWGQGQCLSENCCVFVVLLFINY